MKWLFLLACFAPAAVLAAVPTSLAQIALDHVKDPSGIKLTSVGDRTLIAVAAPDDDRAKGAFWYGVDPGMDAQTARVIWTNRLACPLPDGTGEVIATPSLVLCRTDHDVFAIAPQDGSVRWHFHHKKLLAPMATAGQRVAVNAANEELAVLDLPTGRVLRRFALGGAPLQAAAMSAHGPLALIVAKRADSTAPGHSHQIIAQPLAEAASTTDARLEPLTPLWLAPFGGADYRLLPSQGLLVTTPVTGVVDARDLASGRVLWAEPTPLLPTLEPLAEGLAIGGIRTDGVRWIGLADARSKITAWRRPWTLGALHGVGLDNGHVVWLGDDGWEVTRVRDGNLEASGALHDDAELATVQAADHVLTLLLWRHKLGGTLQQVALQPTQPPPPVPALPPPDWLVPGRQLVFFDFVHGGRDPQTLLPGDGTMQALTVWPEASASGFTFAFRRQDAHGAGPEAKRTIPDEALATAPGLELSGEADGSANDRTTLQLSQAVWQTLTKTGHADLLFEGEALALHLEGPSSVRLQVRNTSGLLHWADVDTQVAVNENGKVRLWLMALGDRALAIRAETPRRTWALMNVDWRPPTLAAPEAKRPERGQLGRKTTKLRSKKPR